MNLSKSTNNTSPLPVLYYNDDKPQLQKSTDNSSSFEQQQQYYLPLSPDVSLNENRNLVSLEKTSDILTTDPSQQIPLNQPIIQYVSNIGTSATITKNSKAAIIQDRRFYPPSGAAFIQGHKLQIKFECAKNLVAGDLNGKSDPYIVLKSESLNIKATKVIEKTLNPIWNETIVVDIKSPEKDILIIEVYDHDLIGEDDFLGYSAIDLSLLPFGLTVKTIEKLSYAKHGFLKVEITALDFGVTNIPESYISTYEMWRNEYIGRLNKKDFKYIKEEAKRTKKDSGPYYGKVTYHGYKFYYGYVKKRTSTKKNVSNVATNIGVTTLKVVGYTIAYSLLLPVTFLTKDDPADY